MKLLKNHSAIALVYFFIIALLGLIMRLFPIIPIIANYKFLLHTHSHIALLGWVYTAFTTLIYFLYLHEVNITKKYKILFFSTQITIIGMLLSFPFVGYAVFSIIFSTLFLITSYFFAWLVFKYTPHTLKHTNSYKFIRVALLYMILSSIGPWTLGIIMNTLGQNSHLYKNAIYFYLHFQYNGWFIFVLLGLFTRILEQQNILIPKKEFSKIFWLFNIGAILTFLISILWMEPKPYINLFAGIGSVMQLIAFTLFVKKLRFIKFKSLTYLLNTFICFFSIKLILQLIACFPYFSKIISYNVDFVIGYIHWVFLGVVNIALLIFLSHYKLLKINISTCIMYLIGFILTEALLFYKGTVIWLDLILTTHYYLCLAIASAIIFISITVFCLIQLTHKKD